MNKNKRDLLKGLAVGSMWTAPVVSSVVLPVHAVTTNLRDSPLRPPMAGDNLSATCFDFCAGPAIELLTVVNDSLQTVMITGVSLSNPNHSLTSDPFPVSLAPVSSDDQLCLTVEDSIGVACVDDIRPGTASVHVEGFADYVVQLP